MHREYGFGEREMRAHSNARSLARLGQSFHVADNVRVGIWLGTAWQPEEDEWRSTTPQSLWKPHSLVAVFDLHSHYAQVTYPHIVGVTGEFGERQR